MSSRKSVITYGFQIRQMSFWPSSSNPTFFLRELTWCFPQPNKGDQALISWFLLVSLLDLNAGILSNDLKDRMVKWYYEYQEIMKEIATHARCSIGTVSNVLRLYRKYGEVKDPFRQRTGWPSNLLWISSGCLEDVLTDEDSNRPS